MDRNRTSPHQRQRPFLTKSRFKTAIECETKLYYAHKGEYPNKKQVDPFLEALAEGGRWRRLVSLQSFITPAALT